MAAAEDAPVSAVQPTRESQLTSFGAVGGPFHFEHMVPGQERRMRATRGTLAREGIWLVRLLLRVFPQEPEVMGLAAMVTDRLRAEAERAERTVRDERRNYVGVQQTYSESGALESESTYERGTLVRKKSYKDGRLVSVDEYFEDGSRKSMRKD